MRLSLTRMMVQFPTSQAARNASSTISVCYEQWKQHVVCYFSHHLFSFFPEALCPALFISVLSCIYHYYTQNMLKKKRAGGANNFTVPIVSFCWITSHHHHQSCSLAQTEVRAVCPHRGAAGGVRTPSCSSRRFPPQRTASC